MKIPFYLLLYLLSCGCVVDRASKSKKSELKLFNNLHVADRKLAGVRFVQVPEIPEENTGFHPKSHPSAVFYYFWNGRLRIVQYTPSGDVIGDSWFDKEPKLFDSLDYWKGVDFRYGFPRK